MIYLHKYHRGEWREVTGFRKFANAEAKERILQRAYGRCGWTYELSQSASGPLERKHGCDGKGEGIERQVTADGRQGGAGSHRLVHAGPEPV